MALIDLIAPLARAGTTAVSAYDAGKARRGKADQDLLLQEREFARAQKQDALKQQIAQQGAQRNALLNELTQAQIGKLTYDLEHPTPKAPVMGSPEWQDAKRFEASLRPQGGGGGGAPVRWPTVQAEGGFFQVDPLTGRTRPVRLPGGEGQLQTKTPTNVKETRVANQRAISTIDDALKALSSHEGAVGPTRGWVDIVDQFLDPEGTEARAGIADVGSLEIRKRSGAAVTASEFPRLAPFIPSPRDRPEVARRKLERMKQIIQEESDAYEQAFPGNRGGVIDQGMQDDDAALDALIDAVIGGQ